MIEPVGKLDLENIDWVIVGGESGVGARQIEAAWVREVREQCVNRKRINGKHVCFFFKQWGGINKKKNGKTLDGKIWNEMPIVDF